MGHEVISRSAAKAARLKRYFTGEHCAQGHIAPRFTCDCKCVECHRLKARSPILRARRREYMRDHQREYRRLHPDRTKATARRSYAKHADKRRAEKRAQHRANPDLIRRSLRKSYLKHRARRLEEMRIWRRANKQKVLLWMRGWKAARRAAGIVGRFTPQDVERLLIAQQGKCVGCTTDLHEKFEVDHIVPLARGGTNAPDNLQLLCPFCNKSKGAKSMSEWLSWREERNTLLI